VVLPSGRVYGSDRLKAFNKKVGTESGWIRDPVGGIKGEAWRESEVRKVYIL
jgi:macrophage erythroblast attacher